MGRKHSLSIALPLAALAMAQQRPLVCFVGVDSGICDAVMPVYVSADGVGNPDVMKATLGTSKREFFWDQSRLSPFHFGKSLVSLSSRISYARQWRTSKACNPHPS
jgi:hypothetical protein